MKKTLCVWVLFVFLFELFLSGCQNQDPIGGTQQVTGDSSSKQISEDRMDAANAERGVLMVDDTVVDGAEVRFVPHSGVLIPFVSLLDHFGIEVQWETDRIARFSYKYHDYVLDLDAHSLKEKETNTELFCPAPGATSYFETLDREILVDSSALTFFTTEFDCQIEIEWKDRKAIVHKTTGKSAKLMMNGEVIDENYVRFDTYKGVMIPVVILLETKGIDIDWKSDVLGSFIYQDTVYQLDLAEKSLVNAKGENLFLPAQGTDAQIETFPRELLVDSITLEYSDHSFEACFGLELSVDWNNEIVEVLER